MQPVILLCCHNPTTRSELSLLLASSGFAVRPFPEVSAGLTSRDAAAVLIDATSGTAAPASLTRRLRAELAGDVLPILWLLPDADPCTAALGLDSGADVVLCRPIDEAVLAAQFRAATRTWVAACRLTERASESRMLGEQFARAIDQHARDHAVARRVQRSINHRTPPQMGGMRVHVCYRPGGQTGGGFHRVQPIDDSRFAFLVGDVSGSGLTASVLATLFASWTVHAGIRDAGSLLEELNSELLRIAPDDVPLVAVYSGITNSITGQLTIARAALSAPVYLPNQGEPVAWHIPGLVLGVTEITASAHHVRLEPGDRLIVGSDGRCDSGESAQHDQTSLVRAVAECRELSGQRFIDSVAAKVLSEVQHEADVTFLSIAFCPDEQLS